MAKNIGILIDPETGDLQIDPRRNDQNVYVQGLQVGEVTIQNQAAILQAMKGELKNIRPSGSGSRTSPMTTKRLDGHARLRLN